MVHEIKSNFLQIATKRCSNRSIATTTNLDIAREIGGECATKKDELRSYLRGEEETENGKRIDEHRLAFKSISLDRSCRRRRIEREEEKKMPSR